MKKQHQDLVFIYQQVWLNISDVLQFCIILKLILFQFDNKFDNFCIFNPISKKMSYNQPTYSSLAKKRGTATSRLSGASSRASQATEKRGAKTPRVAAKIEKKEAVIATSKELGRDKQGNRTPGSSRSQSPRSSKGSGSQPRATSAALCLNHGTGGRLNILNQYVGGNTARRKRTTMAHDKYGNNVEVDNKTQNSRVTKAKMPQPNPPDQEKNKIKAKIQPEKNVLVSSSIQSQESPPTKVDRRPDQSEFQASSYAAIAAKWKQLKSQSLRPALEGNEHRGPGSIQSKEDSEKIEESPKECEQVPSEDRNEDDLANVNDFSDLVRNTSFSRSGEFGQQKNQLREEEAKKELEEGKEEDASNQIHHGDPPIEENSFIVEASAADHGQPEELQRSSGGSSEASQVKPSESFGKSSSDGRSESSGGGPGSEPRGSIVQSVTQENAPIQFSPGVEIKSMSAIVAPLAQEGLPQFNYEQHPRNSSQNSQGAFRLSRAERRSHSSADSYINSGEDSNEDGGRSAMVDQSFMPIQTVDGQDMVDEDPQEYEEYPTIQSVEFSDQQVTVVEEDQSDLKRSVISFSNFSEAKRSVISFAQRPGTDNKKRGVGRRTPLEDSDRLKQSVVSFAGPTGPGQSPTSNQRQSDSEADCQYDVSIVSFKLGQNSKEQNEEQKRAGSPDFNVAAKPVIEKKPLEYYDECDGFGPSCSSSSGEYSISSDQEPKAALRAQSVSQSMVVEHKAQIQPHQNNSLQNLGGYDPAGDQSFEAGSKAAPRSSFDLGKQVQPIANDGKPQVADFSSYDLSEAEDLHKLTSSFDGGQNPAVILEQSLNASASAHNRYLQESISNIEDPFDTQQKAEEPSNRDQEVELSNPKQTNLASQEKAEDLNLMQADLTVKASNYEIKNDGTHDGLKNNDDDLPGEMSRIQDEASQSICLTEVEQSMLSAEQSMVKMDQTPNMQQMKRNKSMSSMCVTESSHGNIQQEEQPSGIDVNEQPVKLDGSFTSSTRAGEVADNSALFTYIENNYKYHRQNAYRFERTPPKEVDPVLTLQEKIDLRKKKLQAQVQNKDFQNRMKTLMDQSSLSNINVKGLATEHTKELSPELNISAAAEQLSDGLAWSTKNNQSVASQQITPTGKFSEFQKVKKIKQIQLEMMFYKDPSIHLQKKVKREIPEDQKLKLSSIDRNINKQFISDINLKLQQMSEDFDQKNENSQIQQPKVLIPVNLIFQSLKRFKEAENTRAKSTKPCCDCPLDVHHGLIERQIDDLLNHVHKDEKVARKYFNDRSHLARKHLNVSHFGAKSAMGDMSQLSKSDINDQWYNFIFEEGEKTISEFRLDKTDLDKSAISRSRMSNVSRFSMQSNLSQFQNISIFNQDQRAGEKLKISEGLDRTPHADLPPIITASKGTKTSSHKELTDKLINLLDSIDIFRFVRVTWLLGPFIGSNSIKQRIFDFTNIDSVIDDLDPVHKGIFLYLKDDLPGCLRHCHLCRQIYFKQKAFSFKKEQCQLLSHQMATIFVLELSALAELIKIEQSSGLGELYLKKAHELLEMLPMIVKSRQPHQFTILELQLAYKEGRAFSKLKDIDFISYKLFKLSKQLGLASTIPAEQNAQQIYLLPDEDESKSPEDYCKEIQKQFTKVPSKEILKRIEFFIFGALSAYRNNHYREAVCFISQAPVVCGQQVQTESLLYLEMLKMIEAQLLTKLGEAEQAALNLSNNYFRFNTVNYDQFQRPASSPNLDNQHKAFPNSQDTLATIQCPFDSIINLEAKSGTPNVDTEIEGSFLNHDWCLYKALKYQLKGAMFQQDHLKYKMMVTPVQNALAQDTKKLQRANDVFCNLLLRLEFIVTKKESNKMFHWLLLKTYIQLKNQNKNVELMSNDNFQRVFKITNFQIICEELLLEANEMYQLKNKEKNRNLLFEFLENEPKGKILAAADNFDDEDIEPGHSQEKKLVDQLLQNQSYFYVMLSNICQLVDLKIESIQQLSFCQAPADHIELMTNDSQYNYFNLLKSSQSYQRLTTQLSHALFVFLNSVPLMAFWGGDTLQPIYVNPKPNNIQQYALGPQSKQNPLSNLDQSSISHISAKRMNISKFGDKTREIFADAIINESDLTFEGGSQEGEDEECTQDKEDESERQSVYQTMKVDYFNQKNMDPRQSFNNRFREMRASAKLNQSRFMGQETTTQFTQGLPFQRQRGCWQQKEHIKEVVAQKRKEYGLQGSADDSFPIHSSALSQSYRPHEKEDEVTAPIFDSPGNSRVDLEASRIVLEPEVGPSQLLDSQIMDLDASNIGAGLEFEDFTDQDMTEFDYHNSEGGNVSVRLLAETEDERTNIDILAHSIYNTEVLYKLCLACCLSDANHQLALKIADLLLKLEDFDKKPQMLVMTSFIYLRLNYEHFKKHSQANQDVSTHLQNQESLLQKSLKYFTQFNADRFFNARCQNLTIAMMYAHVQSQLDAYKVLKKQFVKQIEVTKEGGEEYRISIARSKYQQIKIEDYNKQALQASGVFGYSKQE